MRAALADPRLYKDWAGKMTGPDWAPDEVTGFLAVHMLNADPPDHTRLRKLVNKAFTARRVASPGLSLAADPATLRWRPSSLIHGLEALPVRLR